ncbi:hypothetical protein EDWATA_03359 [Edwardsiella tarda ATCC 23685]|uniref:Uncharacterized protein n=1 Tax=Edwardsiella tarda ATCC 23685 TaxID=500638 RepID=D4F9A0_EDWTA|nr:hypothetical protein EDWATA_03359 [Edwardsiella tarda ATCC 23685]
MTLSLLRHNADIDLPGYVPRTPAATQISATITPNLYYFPLDDKNRE